LKATPNSPEHTSEHDAIPVRLGGNLLGMTQLRSEWRDPWKRCCTAKRRFWSEKRL